jgi:hypothetical protein
LVGEIEHSRQTSKLYLRPISSPRAKPGNLEELRDATHDMLCGLQALHSAGYMYRDLQWKNCIKVLVNEKWKWVIIDLEYAGEDGEVWEDEALVSWDEKTLESHEGRVFDTVRTNVTLRDQTYISLENLYSNGWIRFESMVAIECYYRRCTPWELR